MEHLTRDEVEAFVVGSPGVDVDRVRQHLSGCRHCSERMAREARLELALFEAGAAGPVEAGTRARPSRLRVSWVVTLGVSAALVTAVAVLWNGGSRTVGTGYPSALRPGFTCDPADTMIEKPGYTVVYPPDAARKVVALDDEPWDR